MTTDEHEYILHFFFTFLLQRRRKENVYFLRDNILQYNFDQELLLCLLIQIHWAVHGVECKRLW